MDLRTKQKLQIMPPLIITAVMLFAAVASWPYQYYTALRIIVTAASINAAIIAHRYQKKLLILPFLIITILFNPLKPLSLARNLWVGIDIVCGLWFIISIFILKDQAQPEIKEIKMFKKKFFMRPWFYIPVIIVIILVIFGGWQAWLAINGNEQLSGVQNSIPKPVNVIPPLEKGEADLSRASRSNDWPYWRGPNQDGKSNVTGIVKDLSNGLKKVWEVNYLCQGKNNIAWSSVAVSGNRLVVPGRDDDSDLVFCLNSQNGNLIWYNSYKAKTGTSHGPGSRATPYIDEDRVYTFGRGGDIVCWSLTDGKLLWKKNVEDAGGKEPQWGHSCSPLVYQDKVIIQGGGEALVIAYDKMNGNIIWKSMQGEAGYAAVTSIKIEDSNQILVFHGTGLSCLNPEDGTELWTANWKTSYNVNATTPAISDSIVFITSGYGTGCEALKVSQTNAEVLWKNKTIASHHSDPIIIDGYVYCYSGQSNQNKGSFKCVELETGKEMWSTNAIGWGTALYVDEYLVCMDIEGNLFLVEPNPNEFKLVSEFKNALGEVSNPAWTIPVIANGKLYMRYMQRLICYDIMSQ